MPVDLIPLTEAPPKLRLKALLEGVKLVVRDKKLYWKLVSEVLSEKEDMEIKLRTCRAVS